MSGDSELSIDYLDSNGSPRALNTPPPPRADECTVELEQEYSLIDGIPSPTDSFYKFLQGSPCEDLLEQNGTIEPTVQANPCQLNDCDIIETHFEQQTQTNKSNTGSTQQSWETNQLEMSSPINEGSSMNNSNGQSSHSMNENIERIPSMGNQKTSQVGQGYDEGPDDIGNTMLPLHLPTVPINPSLNEEHQGNLQFSTMGTTIEASSPTQQDPSIALLHPLKSTIKEKTDRNTTVSDCYGKSPVLVLHGKNLPDKVQLKIYVVSYSKKGCVQSVYCFVDANGQHKEFESRDVSVSQQRIELDNLRLQKRPYSELRHKQIYTLQEYPSGEMINLKTIHLKELIEDYQLKDIQLVFECCGTRLYSNLLSVSPEQTSQCSLEVSNKQIHPSATTTLDTNEQCSLELTTKIPELFHCTLDSGYKWLELSIKSHASHFFATPDGEKKNLYLRVDRNPFTFEIKNVKLIPSEVNDNNQDEMRSQETHGVLPDITFDKDSQAKLPTVFPNRFQVQIRLLHSENPPDESSGGFYKECQPALTDWLSFQGTNAKRTIEVVCDQSDTYPSAKRRRHQSINILF